MKTKLKAPPPVYIPLATMTSPDYGYYLKMSTLEWTFVTALERFGSDLPSPVCEYRFALPRKWRSDFAWIKHWLLVEIDGGSHQAYGGRHATDADREKLNYAAQLGFRVLRFSGTMLGDDPEGCIETVRQALQKRV